VRLDDFQILAFGGGFSWGDDHGAGVIQALRLRTNIGDRLLDFVAAQKLIIGICNGFQTLVNLGLLPGIDGDYTRRSVALTYNDCGNFRDQWVRVAINPDSPCVFTRGMQTLDMPVRHGEGKFYGESRDLDGAGGQPPDRHAIRPAGRPTRRRRVPPQSQRLLADIAGICDPTGRIFGLMPHPEAYNHVTNHPDWTRLKERNQRAGKDHKKVMGDGIQIFKNAVSFIAAS
jgi:phosphoribosylformylglycinamidine (FGAM) synthase-like amidotransferase family enzyme